MLQNIIRLTLITLVTALLIPHNSHQAWAGEASALKAIQVAPSTWYVQGESALGSIANRNFISNAGFVVTAKSVIVIDALGSPALAEDLLVQIKKITPNPVTHVIVTHYHADHVYGLQVFKNKGAVIIAHSAARDYLNSETAAQRLKISRTELAPWVNAQTQLTPATEWITQAKTLTVDDTVFHIEPVGEAHTPEDLAVFIPKSKVLFAGDIVFKSRIPFVGPTADTQQWIRALDSLLKLNLKTIVPGHGAVTQNAKADLEQTRDYLLYLRQALRPGARDLDPFDEVYQRTDWSRFEALPLFKFANRMNAYNTYIKLSEEKE